MKHISGGQSSRTHVFPLAEIAEVIHGLRTRPSRAGLAVTDVLAVRDVDAPFLTLTSEDLRGAATLHLVHDPDDRTLIHKGDILVMGRGEFGVWTVQGEPGPIYALDPLFIIRPTVAVSPIVLGWSLRRALEVFADPEGLVPTLSASFLRELPVVLPDPNTQEGMERVLVAWDDEMRQLQRYAVQRSREVEGTLMKRTGLAPVPQPIHSPIKEVGKMLAQKGKYSNRNVRRVIYPTAPGETLWYFPEYAVLPRAYYYVSTGLGYDAEPWEMVRLLKKWVEATRGRRRSEVDVALLKEILAATFMDEDGIPLVNPEEREPSFYEELLDTMLAIYSIRGEWRDILITQAQMLLEYYSLSPRLRGEGVLAMAVAGPLMEAFLKLVEGDGPILVYGMDEVVYLELVRQGREVLIAVDDPEYYDDRSLVALAEELGLRPPRIVALEDARGHSGIVDLKPTDWPGDEEYESFVTRYGDRPAVAVMNFSDMLALTDETKEVLRHSPFIGAASLGPDAIKPPGSSSWGLPAVAWFFGPNNNVLSFLMEDWERLPDLPQDLEKFVASISMGEEELEELERNPDCFSKVDLKEDLIEELPHDLYGVLLHPALESLDTASVIGRHLEQAGALLTRVRRLRQMVDEAERLLYGAFFSDGEQ